MKLRHSIYEGPGSHGALRAASGTRGLCSLFRALPCESYFQTHFTNSNRSGEMPPVILSPVYSDREGAKAQGDLSRDLARVLARYPDTESVVVVRSDTAILAGDDLPDSPPPENPVTGWQVNIVSPEASPGTAELAAVDLTVEEMVRSHAKPLEKTQQPTVNLFGPPALNPRAAAEYKEAERLLGLMGVGVNARVPLGGSVAELSRISRAWANLVLYREAAESATLYLQDEFEMPRVTTPMIGAAGTGAVLRAIGDLCGLDAGRVQRVIWGELGHTSKLPWFARLIKPETLRGRRAAIFGDLTYTLGLGYALAREVGLEVAWAGTYLGHLERDFIFSANSFTDDAFYTDDPEEVAARVEENQPDVLIGTYLEERIAETLNVPFLPLCPPAATRPFVEQPLMGYSGSSFLADALQSPLRRSTKSPEAPPRSLPWSEAALAELEEIPAFLRGRARRLAEDHAKETGAEEITRELFERSRI
ncbi:ferredoxin:protochlorophyllide reductase (ATP-dependent) subunit B [soil metagenome]